VVLGFSQLWSLAGNRGEGARIALLDTGVDIHAPEFRDAQIILKDFCNPGGPGLDADGHGTHCAGAILSAAPACTLLSGVIASRSGFFTYDAFFSALRWCMTEKTDVVCICTGERFADDLVHRRIWELAQCGCPLIASVGNGGESGSGAGIFPARHPEVIAVGSVDDRGELSDFTDLPADAEVFCVPGEDFQGPWPGNQHAVLSGTSVSAALIAGMLGLVVSDKRKNRIVEPGYLKALVREASVRKESARGSYLVVDPVELINRSSD
jgi:subtilisin family serine protease